MPDATTSPPFPDPALHASAEAGRPAYVSEPRQETLTGYGPAPSHPLPPPWPVLDPDPTGAPTNAMEDMSGSDDLDEGMDIPLRRPEDAVTRPLFAPGQWVSDPDFWETKTHIAMTGRHPVPRPKTVALTPPQRFNPMARWKSLLVLLVVCLLIVFTVFGALEISQLGTQVLGPARHTATPAATHTIVLPTATPHRKK